MFGINKGRNTAVFLSFRNHMQSYRRLTGRFRAINLNDTAARNAARPQRNINRQDACGDNLHIHLRTGIPQTHNRAFAKIFFNLFQRIGQSRFFAVIFGNASDFIFVCCHSICILSLIQSYINYIKDSYFWQ